MASAPFDLDTSAPADDAVVSQFPSNERTFRDNVSSYLGIDHDITLGYHDRVTLNDEAGSTTFAANKIGIYQNAGSLYFKLASGTAIKIEKTPIPATTKMLFPQTTAPTGWTLDTDVDDRMIRVDSAAGATTGGTWTIDSISAVGDTTLTIAQMPLHGHPYRKSTAQDDGNGSGGFLMRTTNDSSVAAYTGTITSNSNQQIGGTGGSASHTHTQTIGSGWRPLYLDVIKCTKD